MINAIRLKKIFISKLQTHFLFNSSKQIFFILFTHYPPPLHSTHHHHHIQLIITTTFNFPPPPHQWTHHIERSLKGSLFGLVWNDDGTRLLAGCGSGGVVIASVIDRCVVFLLFMMMVLCSTVSNEHSIFEQKFETKFNLQANLITQHPSTSYCTQTTRTLAISSATVYQTLPHCYQPSQ